MEASDYQATEDQGINFLDYLPVLWKYKLWIAAFSLASALYALISGLISPRVYEATAIVMRNTGATEGNNTIAFLAQQLGKASASGRGDNVLLVLKSRTMAEYMVRQLKLQEYYGASSFQAAVGALRGATKIVPLKEGPTAITVEDKHAGKAAEIANSYPEHLNRLISGFSSGAASRQRLFITERLKETEKTLREAEESLKDFQLKNRTVVVATQSGEAIGASARLRGELIATEIELKNLLIFATDSNPRVISLRGKIGELKRQMGQAQYGSGRDLPSMSENPGHSQKEFYLPAAKVPEFVLEHGRLKRDAATQEKVFELLTQQLEHAKIAEAQEVPVVQILDPALPPGNFRPVKIGRNMLLFGMIGTFVAIALALLVDYTVARWPMIKSRVFNVPNP